MKSRLFPITIFVAVALILGAGILSRTYERSRNLNTRVELVKFAGTVPHIFLHSLIIYPEMARASAPSMAGLYQNNMITVAQFKKILSQLYENNFVLIDSRLLYSIDNHGHVHKNDLYVPLGKKPLVLSLDDVNYYNSMKAGGFAHKLVLADGLVKTEVITPEGKVVVTDDGDTIPIVDKFVREHPDFSLNGAKGIIGVTGYDGMLGYRTELVGQRGEAERSLVRPVIEALKKTGWIFASHSYSHDLGFIDGTISPATLGDDITLWQKQVEPLVGPTSIFIGPYGETFHPGDPRRQQLLDSGFRALYGVGLDMHTEYSLDYFFEDRIDIDGYRLAHSAPELWRILGIHLE